MQRAILTLSIISFLAIASCHGHLALAEMGDIGYEFDAPQELNPRGLTIDDAGLLYCSGVVVLGQLVTPMLYVLDTVGGTSRESFMIDYVENTIDEVQPRGCAWDGENVWVLDSGSVPRLLCIDAQNGNLVSSFWVDGRTIGLAYDGEHLVCLKSKSGGGTLIRYDLGGAEHNRADLPTIVGGAELVQAFGLAGDGKDLYVSATCGQSDSIVFVRKEDGSIDSWFLMPESWLYELTFDGLYLWAVDYETKKVMRIDVGRAGNTGTIAVQVNNGSENAEGCPLPYATVTVTVGGGERLSLASDHLGRVSFGAVSVSDNVALTVTKPGYTDHVFQAFPISRGSMNVFECDLAPAGEMIMPCDTSFDEQWALYDQTRVADINAPAAWRLERGDSADVIVAIVSTGIDLNHSDLRANLWLNPGEIDADSVDNDGNGYTDDVFGWSFTKDGLGSNGVFDEDGLGTAVAGIVAASANNSASQFRDESGTPLNVAGVTWGASIMPLKFDGSRQAMWKAIRYAVDMGAKIVLVPVGFAAKSAQLEDAVNYAAMHDVLIVSGTGDSGGVSGYPASFDRVLAVGATDRSGQLAAYSNVGGIEEGRKVDVAAPGGSGGPGDENGIFTTLPTYPCNFSTDGYAGGYDYVHGTAYSAAFAAGACALLRSQQADATFSDIADRLKLSARFLGDANQTGAGLIDIHAALTGASNDQPPVIEAVTLSGSYISEAEGGDLFIYAEISTPDGKNDVARVELYFEGAPTGILMRDDGADGDLVAGDDIFSYSIHVFPGMFAAGQYLVGIAATDSSGQQSDMWPYLTVKGSSRSVGGCQLAVDSQRSFLYSSFILHPSSFIPSDGRPTIQMAGLYGSSVTTEGGTVKITATVRDAGGMSWTGIDRVELFLEGQSSLGIYLWDNGMQGDEMANDGNYTFFSGVGGLAVGHIMLELVAFDNAGQRSDTWPYLTVH